MGWLDGAFDREASGYWIRKTLEHSCPVPQVSLIRTVGDKWVCKCGVVWESETVTAAPPGRSGNKSKLASTHVKWTKEGTVMT